MEDVDGVALSLADIVSVVSIEAASDLMVLHPLKQVGHSSKSCSAFGH